MTIIGQAGGDVNGYLKVISNLGAGEPTICLGNLGMKKSYDSLLDYPLDVLNHNVLMSYDDYYPYLYYPISLGDMGMVEDVGFIRGSEHTKYDTCNRAFPGQSFELDYDDICFPTMEQLNDWEFQKATDILSQRKPKIMLSSEIPQVVFEHFTGNRRSTNTRRNLDNLWATHKPDIWVFSNYDMEIDETFYNTRFVGLGKLETFKF